jgi:CHAT domain-containing protein
MSFRTRFGWWLLALSLSCHGHTFALIQPASAAPTVRQSADETALRALAEAFYKTWAAKDLDGYLRWWSARSPELEARKKVAAELFAASEKIELKSLTVRQIKFDGEKARVHVATNVQVIEAKTGKEQSGYGEMLRTLECVWEADRWKVVAEMATHDELAAALLTIKTDQAQLAGKTSLVIVPDDKLWELPFQALLGAGDRYVIETSAVSYAPSLTVLREMKTQREKRQAQTTPSALLALGNPAIGWETVERATLTLRDGKLDPLPEAEAEVKALGQLYGAARSKVYVGAEAREDRAKAEAAQAGILHFATHGILNDAAPLYSHLMLAQGDKNEDGLLEAWELMQLDLKADLAVLSACETARGRFGAGEGVIGLTWALFVAGVPATVVSQWKVESASTRELMIAFHRRLRAPAAGTTKAAALRQAALSVLKNPATSHPFYWAGFVLVGDGR